MSSTSGFARQRSSSAAASPVVAAASATAGGGAGEGVQGAMLDAPSASNKNWVRLLAISGTAAYSISSKPCPELFLFLVPSLRGLRRHDIVNWAAEPAPLPPPESAGTVAAAARGTAYLPTTGIAFVHLLAYGVWLGSMVWTTFVAGERERATDRVGGGGGAGSGTAEATAASGCL